MKTTPDAIRQAYEAALHQFESFQVIRTKEMTVSELIERCRAVITVFEELNVPSGLSEEQAFDIREKLGILHQQEAMLHLQAARFLDDREEIRTKLFDCGNSLLRAVNYGHADAGNQEYLLRNNYYRCDRLDRKFTQLANRLWHAFVENNVDAQDALMLHYVDEVSTLEEGFLLAEVATERFEHIAVKLFSETPDVGDRHKAQAFALQAKLHELGVIGDASFSTTSDASLSNTHALYAKAWQHYQSHDGFVDDAAAYTFLSDFAANIEQVKQQRYSVVSFLFQVFGDPFDGMLLPERYMDEISSPFFMSECFRLNYALGNYWFCDFSPEMTLFANASGSTQWQWLFYDGMQSLIEAVDSSKLPLDNFSAVLAKLKPTFWQWLTGQNPVQQILQAYVNELLKDEKPRPSDAIMMMFKEHMLEEEWTQLCDSLGLAPEAFVKPLAISRRPNADGTPSVSSTAPGARRRDQSAHAPRARHLMVGSQHFGLFAGAAPTSEQSKSGTGLRAEVGEATDAEFGNSADHLKAF